MDWIFSQGLIIFLIIVRNIIRNHQGYVECTFQHIISVQNGLICSRACSDFCPHHVSHYLGMDVHDTAQVPRNIPLQPGMVITVEPGLYISKSSKFLPPNRSEFAGIGVRIEDDVLITIGEDRKLSCKVLSSECPKTVHEIENLILPWTM